MTDTKEHVLVSWVRTSKIHAYPNIQFRGTKEDCNKRRTASNFPRLLDIVSRDYYTKHFKAY